MATKSLGQLCFALWIGASVLWMGSGAAQASLIPSEDASFYQSYDDFGNDDDIPDEEDETERALMVDDTIYDADEDLTTGDDDIPDEGSGSGAESTAAASGSTVSSSSAASAEGGAGSAVSSNSTAGASGVYRLSYNKGNAYVVQATANSAIRLKAQSSADVLLTVKKNDLLIRVGSLQRGEDGKVWARIALGGNRMGYIRAAALASTKSAVTGGSKLYTATMTKSVYISDESGSVYKDAVLRQGSDVAVTSKLYFHDRYWYTLATSYVADKHGGSSMLLVAEEAVRWPNGEPAAIDPLA